MEDRVGKNVSIESVQGPTTKVIARETLIQKAKRLQPTVSPKVNKRTLEQKIVRIGTLEDDMPKTRIKPQKQGTSNLINQYLGEIGGRGELINNDSLRTLTQTASNPKLSKKQL